MTDSKLHDAALAACQDMQPSKYERKMRARLCPTCAERLMEIAMRTDLTRGEVEIKVNVCEACKPILAGQQEN